MHAPPHALPLLTPCLSSRPLNPCHPLRCRLLDDPNALVAQLEDSFGAEGGEEALETDSRLRDHAQGRRALGQLLSPEAVVQSILRAFSSQREFCARMLELDERLIALRKRMRRHEAARRKLLAELQSMMQLYMSGLDAPSEAKLGTELVKVQALCWV